MLVLGLLCGLGSPSEAAGPTSYHGWRLPDPRLTPGSVRTIDRRRICTEAAGDERHVTTGAKRRAFEAYGVPSGRRGHYRIDHLISLTTGGDNTLSNLFVQPARESRAKDRLEVRLHAMICHHQITPTEAQRIQRHDWTAGYRAYVEGRLHAVQHHSAAHPQGHR